jgi:hypothetical protein
LYATKKRMPYCFLHKAPWPRAASAQKCTTPECNGENYGGFRLCKKCSKTTNCCERCGLAIDRPFTSQEVDTALQDIVNALEQEERLFKDDYTAKKQAFREEAATLKKVRLA